MPFPVKHPDLVAEIAAMEDSDTLIWRRPQGISWHSFSQTVKRYGRQQGHELLVVESKSDRVYIIADGEPEERTYGRSKKEKSR